MVTMRYIATALMVTLASACHSKNDAPPPYGAFATQAEAKLQADRQNAARADVIAKDKALGVRDEYLPCGTFKPAKEVNGYWYVHEDTAGCPPTAGQPDMHIELRGAGKSPVSKPGDKSPKEERLHEKGSDFQRVIARDAAQAQSRAVFRGHRL